MRGYCDDLELEEMGKVTIPYTGNAAADGVLYHYGCIARAKNIEFSVCCYLKDIAIPDTDFVRFCNALDNAVTAPVSMTENALLKLLRRRNTTCF